MTITKIILYLIYSSVIIIVAVYSIYRPSYNWDILPYTASAYSIETSDTNAIHSKTYEAVKNTVDAKTFLQLTTGEYREAMASCPKCFVEQLPFYKIRAFYV